RQRLRPHFGQPDDAHAVTVPAVAPQQRQAVRLGAASGRRGPGYVPRRRRLAARTIAAVPITATVAPAAVMVASFRGRRRPAARCAARAASRAASAVELSWAGRQPASRSAWQSTTQG